MCACVCLSVGCGRCRVCASVYECDAHGERPHIAAAAVLCGASGRWYASISFSVLMSFIYITYSLVMWPSCCFAFSLLLRVSIVYVTRVCAGKTRLLHALRGQGRSLMDVARLAVWGTYASYPSPTYTTHKSPNLTVMFPSRTSYTPTTGANRPVAHGVRYLCHTISQAAMKPSLTLTISTRHMRSSSWVRC